MVDLSAYEGIVFDMDGTLIDSMGSHLQAWEQTCLAFGYPYDEAYLHRLGGVPTKTTVELLNEKHGLAHDPEEVGRYKKYTWQKLDHTPTLIAETAKIFDHYRPSLKIGIGTGAERSQAEHLLEHNGLLQRIDALVTASDVVRGKPHPETFLTVAKLIGVAPEKCVVFEDTSVGAEAAERAGMDCIMVLNGVIQQP